MVDSLFWPFTQKGEYACKSGYRFLKVEATFKLNGIPIENNKIYGEEFGLYTYQTN